MVCTAKSVSTKDLADKDLNWLYITVEFLLKQFIYLIIFADQTASVNLLNSH